MILPFFPIVVLIVGNMDPAIPTSDRARSDDRRAPADDSRPQRQRQFSLAQLLAAMLAIGVLLAAVRLIVVFERTSRLDWGIVIVAFVAVAIFLEALRMHTVALLWGAAGGLFLISGLVQMGLSTPRHAALRMSCAGRLKQIVVALHSYHDEYGSFPPAVVRDDAGRPMHSWRVLLLRYLEESRLYEQYRFDEPWDGPNNKKLYAAQVLPYVCDAARRGRGGPVIDTSYVVVVGPRTAFPEDRCVALSDITDDQGSTILVVEVHNSGIHWMEPRDLHVTQMPLRINPSRGQGISSPHPPGGANAVMADGSLQYLSEGIPPETLYKLLTIDGGEPVVWQW